MACSVRPLARLGAILAAVIALAGCGLFGEDEKPSCPTISVLRDTERLTIFRYGAGRDVNDIEFEAEFGEVRASCELKSNLVMVRSRVALLALRGAAGRGSSAPLSFFVAVVDPAGRILSKEVFDSPIAFKPQQQRAGSSEEIDHSVPLAAGTRAEDYEILIGFQLTAEQLEYNRRRRPQ
ncbi:MAG: hypothetical protein EXQ91_00035 [Alphaproteobacteria bacterium]|nr:hypothetical protein [Alphaproteobacteria bacterium]